MKGFRQAPRGNQQIEGAFERAVKLHSMARLPEAAEIFASILRKSPTHFGSLHRFAAIRRQQGQFEEALALLKKAISCNPGSADVHNSLGNTLQALERHEEAIGCYRRALDLRSNYPEAHNNLANSLGALGRKEEAVAHYRKAIALRPDYMAAHTNLGGVLTTLRRPEEALAILQAVLALDPDSAAAHNNLGNALMALNRQEDAVPAFARARQIDPKLREPQFNEAIARLALGDYTAGWLGFEMRRANTVRRFPQPRWESKTGLAAKTVLLCCEQGLGDTIQFARYAELVAQQGARVILQAPKPLSRLFQSLRGPSEVITENDALPDFDFHASLLSLPLAFGTTLESIPAQAPYLHAPAASKIGIGLCWAGNPGYANDHNRSIPLSVLQTLLDIPGARFVTLQKDFRAGDEEVLAGRENVDWRTDREGRDFADTAALMAGLDLIITVDTAVAHLAGALGLPVWVLLPFSAHWAWLRERGDSPWYPSARLFRQPAIGDWQSVTSCVAAALRERLSCMRRT